LPFGSWLRSSLPSRLVLLDLVLFDRVHVDLVSLGLFPAWSVPRLLIPSRKRM
jgi:hypothetical protein